jgi:hypothetical protein
MIASLFNDVADIMYACVSMEHIASPLYEVVNEC